MAAKCILADRVCPERNTPVPDERFYCPAWVEGIIECKRDGTMAERATSDCYFRVAPRWSSQSIRAGQVHAHELSAMRDSIVNAVVDGLFARLTDAEPKAAPPQLATGEVRDDDLRG
jgi:hypothetical protein